MSVIEAYARLRNALTEVRDELDPEHLSDHDDAQIGTHIEHAHMVALQALEKTPDSWLVESTRSERQDGPDLARENAELREKLAAYEEPARRRERMGEIVAFCFPRYDARKARDPNLLIHPERAWWWNGAGIDENEVELGSKGYGASCKVTSYVGGGETDSFVLEIPAEWMDADDFRPVASKWIIEETARRKKAKEKHEIAEAEAALAAAQRHLEQTKGKS